MGRSKEAFMETREGSADINEYFQWLTDLEWQQHVEKCEDYIHEKFGHGLHATLELQKLLKRKENGVAKRS
jgi:hypothetical protein